MAISKLVTGTPFERPAITFSTKSADSNMQKASSSLLTNKSSMGDLADSMSRLNIQLTQLQKVSNEIMKSIASVLKTVAKVDRDMTDRFRTLNKELAASRTEFTRSLAAIAPSLTGGAGATISGAALGAAAPAAAADAIPSSGDSTWDAFISFLKIAAPLLLGKIGKKLATMAILAATGIGWIGVAIGLALSIGDAIELYKLWKQFKNEKPDQSEIDGAMASYNKAQPPIGAPQGAQLTDMSMSGETGAFAEAAGSKAKSGSGAPEGGAGPAAASTSAAGTTGSSTREASAEDLYKTPGSDANDPSKAAASTPAAPAAPTDMSIGGETGAFGAARQSAAAPQPMRRPAETAPAATTGAPIMAPPDPHAKSKAMFQQQQDMERNGDSGATAMFFAADQQRQKELAGLKAIAAAPGAPVEAKKAAAKSIQDATNPATFGRGGGHTTGETTGAIGRGGGDHTDPRMLGRGGGLHSDPNVGYEGKNGDILQQALDAEKLGNLGSGETGMNAADVRGANMQNASNMMEAKYKKEDEDAMGATHAKGITSTVDSNAARDAMLNMQGIDDKDRANSAATKPLEQKRVDIDAGKIEPETGHDAMGKTIRGMQGTPADQPGAPGLGDSIMKALDSLGFGTPSAKPAATAPTKIEPEGDESAGYKGKLGQILQTNMNDYNVMNKSAGGDTNVTPNIPLSATNPFLNRFFGKQKMENHQ